MRTFSVIVAILVTSVVVSCGSSSSDEAPPPPATKLYATTVPNPNSALYELNPTTGEFVKFIGTIPYAVNGLDWDTHSGRLLATTPNWEPNAPSVLLRIDPATADATLIGTTQAENLVNLAAKKDGSLFSWNQPSSDLVSLSPTGVASVVANSGISSYSHSLKFDSHDTLWFVNGDGEVYVMDYATGLGSTVGNLGTTAHHGDFSPDTGKFWGIDSTGNPRNFVVATLDPAAVVTVRPAPDDIHAITFRK